MFFALFTGKAHDVTGVSGTTVKKPWKIHDILSGIWDLYYDIWGGAARSGVVVWNQKYQKIGSRETSTAWMSYWGFWFCWGTEAVGTTIITIAAESESNWGRLDPEVQPSCSEQGHLNRLLVAVTGWVLNILKDGNTAVCLSNVFHCSIALTGWKIGCSYD